MLSCWNLNLSAYILLDVLVVNQSYQVAMGQDAEEINNKLLEVIRPIVARLSAAGVLPNRDYRTVCFLTLYQFSCFRDYS